jgi:hypothetical protein
LDLSVVARSVSEMKQNVLNKFKRQNQTYLKNMQILGSLKEQQEKYYKIELPLIDQKLEKIKKE